MYVFFYWSPREGVANARESEYSVIARRLSPMINIGVNGEGWNSNNGRINICIDDESVSVTAEKMMMAHWFNKEPRTSWVHALTLENGRSVSLCRRFR
jgi:hypothetical protein